MPEKNELTWEKMIELYQSEKEERIRLEKQNVDLKARNTELVEGNRKLYQENNELRAELQSLTKSDLVT